MPDTTRNKSETRLYFTVVNDLSYDQRMIRICTSLAEVGYQVTLIGRKLRSSVPLGEMPFRQHRLRCLINSGPLFYLEYNIRLWFYLIRQRPAAICACDLDTALAVSLTGMLKSAITVFDAHEYFTEVPELYGRNIVKRIWTWIGKMTVKRFALRYTVSESMAKALTEKYHAPFEVVRNVPSSTREPILPLEAREFVILYQGALNAGRGLETAISAMRFIEGFQLVLAGEGDLSQALRSFVKNENLEEKVRFLGRIKPDKLKLLSRKAMIGLNLLEGNSLSYGYSLANKFFDYIHAGVPSVNPPFTEYVQILKSHQVGITIERLEPEILGSAMRALLSDRPRLTMMIESCSHVRKLYCWEKEQHKLLELYNRLDLR